MTLPEFGVKKPVTNLMIFFAVFVLAGYSLTRVGIDSFPKIEPPMITVIATYPGASPEDVETKVTEVLENQLGTTPGLEKIASVSSEGSSRITLKFIWGTNLDEASNDIRDRIDLAKRFLPDIPDEMENPFIFKFNTANIPIIFVGITAQESYAELYDLIDRRISDALKQLPGVGTVNFQGGGLERQINILIDRQQLEGYGFSILDIKNVLKQENITQPVGNIKTGLKDYSIRLPGEFKNVDEIKSIILGKRSGRIVYLRDVAQIEDGFKEVVSLVRINKEPGLVMMVQKQSGSNTVEVAGRIKKRIKELEQFLPKDVKLNIIFDTSGDIITSLRSLSSSVLFAILLVIFVVWFFLRQFKPSAIIALTIPFSLLMSFIYIFLSGGTINTISLSSLAIASGMVVDNAIVVVDNIFRKLSGGANSKDAAIVGTSEIFLAIAASTLTTVVVFVPLLFVPGVVGIMFKELAVIIIVTILASLFTAGTFTPMLCSRWLTQEGHKAVGPQSHKLKVFTKFYDISEKWFVNLEKSYSNCLVWCLGHKKIVVFGFTGMFFASLLLIPLVGSEFIPEEDTGDLRLTIELPIGTRLEETNKVVKRVEEIFESDAPEAKYFFVRSGDIPGMGRSMGYSSGSYIISAGTKLVAKSLRKRSVREVAEALRRKIKTIAGVAKTDISVGNPIGRLITGFGGKAVQIELIGHSFEDTNELAGKIKEAMEKVPGTVDVSISRDINRPELIIEVDRQKAASLGLRMETISETVKTFITGSSATKYRDKGKTYDIFVRLNENSRSQIADIENLSFILPFSSKTESVKLVNMAKISQINGPQEIARQNRERIVKVQCNVHNRSTGKVLEDIKSSIEKIVIPSDIIVNFGGEAEEQKKAFTDLALLLVLGIILVYMVMAAQFESLLDPFIIMFAIPPTFTGVILAFLIADITLSITSFLGVVMLMGIVVNNGIVLVSYIAMLRERGLSMLEAVASGGRDRLRPVLMTTITTLVGLLPLAISRGEGSESWRPLGVAMLGGLSVSTFVTMFLVPVLYAVFEEKVKKNGKK